MRGKIRKTVKILFILLIFAAAFLLTSAVYLIVYFYHHTPDARDISNYSTNGNIIFYDRTGQHVLYEMYREENKKILTHDEIPDIAREAVIAAEDDNFYSHPGFDLESIARALKVDIENRRITQGGSTITQQLARNIFLTRERTLERKIKEVIMAVKIERQFSKEEILDIYLNEMPSVSNTKGIEVASRTLFGKDARDLKLDEAALIAALPKAPAFYSPYGDHKRELVSRQRYILQRMRELYPINEKEIDQALREDTLKKILPPVSPIEAPHFVFYAIDQLPQVLDKEVIEKGGLKVITTVDYDMQKRAEQIIREGALSNEKKFGAENAALVALDPKSGEVLAMVGSRDYFDSSIDGKVNVALRPRQPGSAFKPIVYAKAFEKGYQPETLLNDVKTNFGPDGSGKNYIPSDFDGRTRGIVSMRQALAMSLNIPSVQTLYLSGVKDSIGLAQKLGITTLDQPNRYGLALVLGGGDVKLLELSGAYAVFADDGIRVVPHAIRKVEGIDGHVYYQNNYQPVRVLDSEIARKISSILSDKSARSPIFGRVRTLDVAGRMVAVKTGTTQDFRDGWTIGYTPYIVAGVWAGNNDNRPMRRGEPGVTIAAPLWQKFMNEFATRYPNADFLPYQKVISHNFLVTGKRDLDNEDNKDNQDDEQKKLAEHSILYYVNKDAPLSFLPPDHNDPMFLRWEKSFSSSQDDSKDNNDKKDKKKDKHKKKKD